MSGRDGLMSSNSNAPLQERFVDSSEALQQLLGDLESAGVTRCAVDTEADSLHSYKEKLCLVQMNAGGILAIIDPLALEENDLLQLLDFISEREIWMHGADFDMTLMQRTFSRVPERILDTQLAARLIGADKFGLANLIDSHFGVSLSKSSQKADWGARPLKDKLLRYAFDDVRYLLDLADQLCDQLRTHGRHDWFEEWCLTARQNVLARPERSPEEIWRINGWGNLERKGLAFLRAIWHWRDGESQIRDCPPFRVMSNQKMLELAEIAGSGKEVKGAKGLRAAPLRRFQEALAKTQQLPASEYPPKRLRRGGRREEVNAAAYEALRDRRNQRAESLGIDPTIIATRNTLENLSIDASQAEDLLMKWQRELLFDNES